MVKIGIDARLWNETGVGRYIRNLVLNLEKQDKQNEYILFFRKPEFESVELHGKNFQKRLADIRWHTLSEQLTFPQLLQKEHLDLVHFPYFSVPIFYSGNFVVTVHDVILHHFPTGKASTLPQSIFWAKYNGYKIVLSQAVRKAKKILTVSQATKKELIDHFSVSEEKIEVTYEGIDDGVIAKKNMHFGNSQPYFLYVGNAYPHKNLEMLLSAFGKLKQANTAPIHLVFVGKEDFFYKKLKEKVARSPVASSVTFYEHISDGDLSLLYQHAVALVLPSLMEGFGLPAVEAMANGCLVACSHIPALLEICKDVAEYFNPSDADDIFRVLQGILYAAPLYINRKRLLGRKRAKEFSWEKMTKQTHQLYESCISI